MFYFFYVLLMIIAPINAMNNIQKSLLAGTIGDALGRVTEFIPSTNKIFSRYPGGLKKFQQFKKDDWHVPSIFVDNKIAPYTDDTAMTLLVMKELINSKQKNLDCNTTMGNIAQSFVQDMDNPLGWMAPFRAPGNCCICYCTLLKEKIRNNNFTSDEWWKVSPANGKTGGCGSVMHAHPFGLVFYDDPDKAKLWAAKHSTITHGDNTAQAACAAMAIATAYALQNKEISFIISEMIAAAQEYSSQTAACLQQAVWSSLQAKIRLRKYNNNVYDALADQSSDFRQWHDAFFEKYQGWSAHDAIAGALYIFLLTYSQTNAVHDGLYLAVNTPGDSDSIASMAGALLGAYGHSIPQELMMVEGIESLLKEPFQSVDL